MICPSFSIKGCGGVQDRVAPGGELVAIQPVPPLLQQFPLKCRVVKYLYEGKRKKVAAFKVPPSPTPHALARGPTHNA